MWTATHEHADKNTIKKYARKHQREYLACVKNLEDLIAFLNGGATLQQAESGLGFFSTEGGNVYRITQTGVPHAKETRLYVYAVVLGDTIHVLTIGDKDSQKRDLLRCREIIRTIP